MVIAGVGGEETAVEIELQDINGNARRIGLPLRPAALPPVVITEVLGDPRGPEPAQEFIEIKNVGNREVDLTGWMIDDNNDRDGDLLPQGSVLIPGAVALIVSDTFDSASPLDPSPDPDALIIRLAGSIGSNGLKNSDPESVELYDAEGDLVSRYDGKTGPAREGESIHRCLAEIPALDPEAFGDIGVSTPGW